MRYCAICYVTQIEKWSLLLLISFRSVPCCDFSDCLVTNHTSGFQGTYLPITFHESRKVWSIHNGDRSQGIPEWLSHVGLCDSGKHFSSPPSFPCSRLKSLRGQIIREERELAGPALRNDSYLTLSVQPNIPGKQRLRVWVRNRYRDHRQAD